MKFKYVGRFIENIPGFPGIKWYHDSDFPDDTVYLYDKKKIVDQIKNIELERINKLK